jgi:4-hydroxybenzoate polyprenyltransferase
MLGPILKVIRVRHWIKNLFVFIPVFISGNISNFELLLSSLIIFLAFSFTASSIYIINDLADLKRDQAHPIKKFRPLPSGNLSLFSALICVAILILGTLFTLSLVNFMGWQVILIYFFINIAYSFYIKHIAILDIVSISSGFVLRVQAGLAVTELNGSFWLIALTFTLSMLLAIGKRKGEFKNKDMEISRPSLEGYSIIFLNTLQGIFVTTIIIFYVLYTHFTDTFPGDQSMLMYSSLFVIIGLCRYLQINLSENSIDEPTDILYQDRFMLLIVSCWVLFILACLSL